MRAVDDLYNANIPFEPPCFGRVASDRKGCLVSVPQESADVCIALEEWAMQQLNAHVPNIKAIWVLSVRPSDHGDHPYDARSRWAATTLETAVR